MVAGATQLKIRTAGTLLVILVLLAGCVPPDLGTPEPGARRPVPAPQPGGKTPPSAVVVQPVPARPPIAPGTVEPQPPPTRTSPPASAASMSLLSQSRSHQAAGRYEQAAASIERALRIEPRQPLLWIELGNIRILEGDYAQAESIGRKALSLSAGDPALTARAEQLIATAKKR